MMPHVLAYQNALHYREYGYGNSCRI